jgi:hypothetical protein
VGYEVDVVVVVIFEWLFDEKLVEFCPFMPSIEEDI